MTPSFFHPAQPWFWVPGQSEPESDLREVFKNSDLLFGCILITFIFVCCGKKRLAIHICSFVNTLIIMVFKNMIIKSQ